MSQSLVCYFCQRPAVEVSGVVQDCECGCRKMVAAPYRAPMNWQERARRDEALLDRLGDSLEAHHAHRLGLPSDESKRTLVETAAALKAWMLHRADLETLEWKA